MKKHKLFGSEGGKPNVSRNTENIETWETFEAQYGTAEERAAGYVKLHSLLRPYIIRRMKKDVEKLLPPKVRLIFLTKNNPPSFPFI